MPFDTLYQTAPFSKIKNEDYLPAFLEAIKEAKAEIDAIATNPDAPTFENTTVSGLSLIPKRVIGAIAGAKSGSIFMKVFFSAGLPSSMDAATFLPVPSLARGVATVWPESVNPEDASAVSPRRCLF